MRKGVILEHKSRSTIVMTGNGEFIKAQKISGAEIGEEVTFEPKTTSSFSFFTYKRTSAATVAIIVIISLFPAYFWYGDNKAYAHVSIDINPSFEAKVNHNMEVLSIEALNEDAELLLEKYEGWEGKALTSVTSELFQTVKEEGMVSNGENALVGVSYLSERGDLDIIKKMQGFFDQQNGSFQVAAYDVPFEWIEEAKKSGKSVHALVDQRLAEDEKAIELESDARELIDSFFRKEEEQQKEMTPPDGKEEETDQPVSSQKNTSPGQSDPSKSEERPAAPATSVEKSESSPVPEPKENNPEKNKKPASSAKDTPSSTNGNNKGNKGQGPPEKGSDHPSNKGKQASENKGNAPSHSKNKEDNPGKGKKENPSSDKKKGGEGKNGKENGNGHGPP